jgi:hypothetical protein
VSPVRPGRGHDTTCARAHGLVDVLNRLTATLGVPTLPDLGYENIGDGFRHPVKKPRGGELTEEHEAFNATMRGVHGMTERANPLPKVTFKLLRGASVDHHPHRPSRPRHPPAGTRPHHLAEVHEPSQGLTGKGSVEGRGARGDAHGA